MERLIFRNKPSSFLHIESNPVIYPSLESLLDLEGLNITNGVIMGSILHEIPQNLVSVFLKKLQELLPKGSAVLASGPDCVECSRYLLNEDMDIKTYNQIMFNNYSSAWNIITFDILMQQIDVTSVTKQLGGIGNCEYYYHGVK